MVITLLLLLLAGMASGICPSKCVCNDKQLKASCEYSNLEVVPIQLNPDIKTLKLNNNKIQSVHLTFIFYTNLMDLDLSVNKIKNLGSKNFEFQMNLIKLNVSRNSIKNLHRDCFKGLEKLAILDLSDNLIEEINDKLYFKHLRNLKELNLSKNNIYLIETGAFDHVENLKRLVLSGNQLMKIPDDAMHSLKNLVELDLNNNLIRDVHFSKNLTNLEIIKIRSNLLGDVGNDSFTNVPRLKKLDLSDNNLTRIQNNHFNNLFYLEFINLSSNTFDVIDSDSFRRLFKLREIHVDDCDRLYRIDSKTFIDNSNLNYVSLSNNHKLKRLPKFLFVNKPNLKHLRISGNDFSTLDASDLPLDNLETLTLGKNPFQCNCSLHWLWVLKERQIYKNCTCGSRTYCYDTCIDNVPKTEKLIKDYYYGKSEEYDGEDLTSSLLSSSPDSDENYEYDNDREKNLRFRSFEKDFLPVILDIDDIYCRGIKSTEKILFKNVAKSNFDCTATWMFILTSAILSILIIFLLTGFVYFFFIIKCKRKNKNPVHDYINATKNYEDTHQTYYRYGDGVQQQQQQTQQQPNGCDVFDVLKKSKNDYKLNHRDNIGNGGNCKLPVNVYVKSPIDRQLNNYNNDDNNLYKKQYGLNQAQNFFINTNDGCSNNKNFSLTTTTETNIYNEPSFPVNMHKNQKPPHIVYV